MAEFGCFLAGFLIAMLLAAGIIKAQRQIFCDLSKQFQSLRDDLLKTRAERDEWRKLWKGDAPVELTTLLAKKP